MMTTLSTKSYGNFYSSIDTPSSSSSFPTSISNFSSPTTSSSTNQINNARWGPPLISINRGCVSSSKFSIDNRNSSNDRSIASSMSRERINQSVNSNKPPLINEQKKACMCSPTMHPGSFRCSLHKNNVNIVSARNCKNINSEFVRRWRSAMANSIVRIGMVRIGMVEGDLMKRTLRSLIRGSSKKQRPRRCDFQRRNCKNINSEFVWRSAMANSIVRIGMVEGDLMKRTLRSLIRGSSKKQRPRRCDFQRRPSRLSVMSKAGD